MLTHFNCRECKKNLPVAEAKKGSVTKIGTGRCKKCQSSYVANLLQVTKSLENPELYMNCNDCNHTFSIYRRGSPPKDRPRWMNTHCPKCQSEEIRGCNE